MVVREAVVVNHVNTAQRVGFIVIHDGYYTDQDAAAYVMDRKLPVTMFLSVNAPAVFENPAYFRQFIVGGHTPQSHGSPHDDMRGKPLTAQLQEIGHSVTEIERYYGARPTLFCPPFGLYDVATKIAAFDSGCRWLVRWSHAVVGDDVMNGWNEPDSVMDRGDIIMCHFDAAPALGQQLQVAVATLEENGLRPAFLTDYLT